MSLNASTAGLRALRLILEMPTEQGVMELGKIKPYLTYPEDQKALEYVAAHLSQYGKMPHPDTVLDQITVFLPPTQETFGFEVGQLRGRFVEDRMREASDDATVLLAESKHDAALDAMLSKLVPLKADNLGYSILDARTSDAADQYLNVLNGTAPPTERIGYPTLDVQGGIEDGDIIGIVGRPGSGKTWLMLYTALCRWTMDDIPSGPVMFVTQEMGSKQIMRRILPLVANVDPTPLYLGKDGGDGYAEAIVGAQEALKSAGSPFLIYDSKMAGTVADIEAIAVMHGVKRIWIDGAYMLRHPDPRLSRYARVAENLDLMKQFTQRTGCALLTSWQFKRGAGKEKQNDATPDLDDIGYSHAIGEYCGVVVGLLENPKDATQATTKKVTIMKGRNGEEGEFKINWSFSDCDFSEVQKEAMINDPIHM